MTDRPSKVPPPRGVLVQVPRLRPTTLLARASRKRPRRTSVSSGTISLRLEGSLREQVEVLGQEEKRSLGDTTRMLLALGLLAYDALHTLQPTKAALTEALARTVNKEVPDETDSP